MTQKEWSFSFRETPFYYDSDSGSDAGETNPSCQGPSNNVDDLDGIDLSVRTDEASYKPNPFSIAKINATYRSKRTDSHKPSKNLKDTAQMPKSGQRTIMEGFRTQALRKRPSKSGQHNGPIVPSRPARGGPEPETKAAPLAALSPPSRVDPPVELDGRIIPVADSRAQPSIFPQSSDPKSDLISGRDRAKTRIYQHNDAHISSQNHQDFKNFAVPQVENALPNRTIRSTLPPIRTRPAFVPNLERRLQVPSAPFSSPLRPTLGQRFVKTEPENWSSPVRPSKSALQPEPTRKFKRVSPAEVKSTNSGDVVEHEGVKSVKIQNKSPGFGTATASNIKSSDPTVPQTTPLETQSVPRHPRGLSDPIYPQKTETRRRRDAYEALNDSDEEWGTLPSRKRKKPKTQVVSFSKTFRLPGLDLHPNLQSKPITASGRRLRIYHPPPFAPPIGAGSRGADIPMNTVLDDHGTGGNIISLSLSAEAQGASDLAKGDPEIIASPGPSPSNSADKKSPAHFSWHMNKTKESDLRIDFDTTVVRKNYYTNREAFRQVLLSFMHSDFDWGVYALLLSVNYSSSADALVLKSGWISFVCKAADTFAGTLRTLSWLIDVKKSKSYNGH